MGLGENPDHILAIFSLSISFNTPRGTGSEE
jgi:hypothetical protein